MREAAVDADALIEALLAAFPGCDIGIICADDITRTAADKVFQQMTAGTRAPDRVWSYRAVLGTPPIHVVALEGSGFTPRYLAVTHGTADDARAMRDALAARDGR